MGTGKGTIHNALTCIVAAKYFKVGHKNSIEISMLYKCTNTKPILDLSMLCFGDMFSV